ncbi:MAG: hypothetical protein AB8G05_03985 [Oligoflexales bacterium]
MIKNIFLPILILCFSSLSLAITVNTHDNFSYLINPKSLLNNNEMHLSSIILDDDNQNHGFLKHADINDFFDLPDSLIIASKYAAILKDKKPDKFHWELVTSESFHASIYKDQTARKLADDLVETTTAVRFFRISLTSITSQTTISLYDQDNKGSHWKNLSKLDSNLGEPSKILITEASKGDYLLLGSSNIYLFYEYGSHTLLVGYQIAATNINDLGRVGSYMAKKKAKSEVKDSLEFRVHNLRTNF